MDKLKGMGNRALALPLGIALLVFCVLGVAVAPMMHMAPRNVPVAVVNLDEGAGLPAGEHLVAGDLIVENIQELADVGEDAAEPAMAFTVLGSREELDENMADYYGAIVIPSDFTEKQTAGSIALATALGEGLQEAMAAMQQQAAAPSPSAAAAQAGPEAAALLQQQAQAAAAAKMQGIVQDAITAQQGAEKPTVELVVNTAKSPVFASTMRQGMATAMASRGVDVEVTSIGDADGDASPLSGMMGIQMMVMPLMILSLIMSLLAFIITRVQVPSADRKGKARAAGVQAVFAVAASLVAGVAAYGIVAWFGGIEVPSRAILLLWFASACIMLVNLGLLGIAAPLGAVVMVCVFALGMATAVLPPEMLPAFWADWVCPWAPQAALGDGLRNIIYLGGGAFDTGMPVLAIWGCVGIVALVISAFAPTRMKG